jgi:hypothetical protein
MIFFPLAKNIHEMFGIGSEPSLPFFLLIERPRRERAEKRNETGGIGFSDFQTCPQKIMLYLIAVKFYDK